MCFLGDDACMHACMYLRLTKGIVIRHPLTKKTTDALKYRVSAVAYPGSIVIRSCTAASLCPLCADVWLSTCQATLA